VIKVLYVEDNDDNLYMLKMRLELLGDFEVLAAEDGEQGCKSAASERPAADRRWVTSDPPAEDRSANARYPR
jgi:CheY-like chemotaxis protein